MCGKSTEGSVAGYLVRPCQGCPWGLAGNPDRLFERMLPVEKVEHKGAGQNCFEGVYSLGVPTT